MVQGERLEDRVTQVTKLNSQTWDIDLEDLVFALLSSGLVLFVYSIYSLCPQPSILEW